MIGTPPYASRLRPAVAAIFSIAVVVGAFPSSSSMAFTDLSIVPLLADQQSEPLNTWGGYWSIGKAQRGLSLEPCDLPSGRRALRIRFRNADAADTHYIQCFASGFGRRGGYYQTRDLARYERLQFRLKNSAGTALRGSVQVKDFRDSPEHSATHHYPIANSAEWTSVSIPLSLAAGWTVKGTPDLSRVLTLDFLFQPDATIAVGQVLLADIALVEPGGPLDVRSAPLAKLAERVARRQWDGLWAARNRVHGLLPNNSYQATDAALNTTAAVLWMLPAATARHWVAQSDADGYVELLTRTIDRLLDHSAHLPPRYADWVTLEPSLLPEESAVDAAFLSLALYQYETLPATPRPLREAIGRTRSRFDFASFASPEGWRMAYRRGTDHRPDGFTACTFDAYTSEGNLISLAAHLTHGRSVPIEAYWSRGTHRARAGLTTSPNAPVVHPMAEYRAPFTQALWNLFVDVRQRGVDNYPDRQLALNPWQNFVCYEQHVMKRLAELGRPCLVQPDAGDDGTLDRYRQFSVYDCCGQQDLFMPWSASLALLSGVEGADTAFRFLLDHRLFDCYGLADSARWTTGKFDPCVVAARHDFWNTSLSTMALLEWLNGPERSSRSFAALPEVGAALDRVFPPPRADQSGGKNVAIAPQATPKTPRAGGSPGTVGASASPRARS